MFLNKKSRLFITLLQKMTNDIAGLIGVIGIGLLFFIYFFNNWLVPYPNLIPADGSILQPPSWINGGDVRFLLGTDLEGRDIFSHLLQEIRPILKMACLVTINVIFISFLLSLFSFVSSSIFKFIKGLSNAIFIIPSILLAMSLCLLLGNSDHTILIALTLALLPHSLNNFTQATNVEIQKDYITMARLDGVSEKQTLFYYLIPNMLTTYIAEIEIIFSFALLEFITLNFLSIGSVTENIHWGVMMKNYINLLAINPWAFIVSGIIIIIITLIIHFFCSGLIKVIRK